jgi:hypothetical protein
MTTRIYRDKRGVRYVGPGQPAPSSFARPATCGTCERTWDDAVITGVTPAPAARCPFEYWHRAPRPAHGLTEA